MENKTNTAPAGRRTFHQRPYLLHTRSGVHLLSVRIAETFFARFAGLMLRARPSENSGMLLMRCPSVHTAFMRFPIDVIYLDQEGVIRKCVPNLKPWRCSVGPALLQDNGPQTLHVLELVAGSIARLDIRVGDILCELKPEFHAVRPACAGQQTLCGKPFARLQRRYRGAAMLEFIVVGPIITLIGLGALQYGMLFFAKNQINHATFMAGRAGAMGNASLERVRTAYEQALVPLYGGGRNQAELAEALARAKADVGGNARIELLSPTKASFDDWNDPALQQAIGGGRRVIPHGGLAFRPETIGPASGQSIQDANLIKLRITHGVEPKVPLVRTIYTQSLKSLDPKTDAFHTQLVNAGRVPVVTHVTLHMLSDAIESSNPVVQPDPNPPGGSNPSDPGAPPACGTGRCDGDPPPTPTDPGGGGQGGGADCAGPNCAPCDGGASVITKLSADVLFPFGKSSVADMLPEGRAHLDAMIAEAKEAHIESVHITGHTDPIGHEEYNQALSLQRAASVRDYLVAHGFPDVPITVEGRGETELVVPLEQCQQSALEAQRACLAENRRVMVEIKGVKQE